DRLLAVVLARVAEVPLLGQWRRAVEVRAPRRRLAEAPGARLDCVRGVQDGKELRELRGLPALEALGELGRGGDGECPALRLDALGGRGLEGTVGREAKRRDVGHGARRGDLLGDDLVCVLDLQLGRGVRTRTRDLPDVLVVEALLLRLQVGLLE